MSKNFKPLYTQVAEQLAVQLKVGTSPIQEPERGGLPAFVKPVNPFTGKGYSVLNALNLSLKGYDDPRWMSLKEASFNRFQVMAGEKGTLINFPKKSDIEAIRDAAGEKVKDGEGKTQTRTIEYEKAQRSASFLFNALQMKEFSPLNEFQEKQKENDHRSPFEKTEKIIRDSGATIIHGGNEAYYDKARDAIFLPEKKLFGNEKQYLQAAIHQLAHWTGHESRLDRPMEGKFGSMEYGKEELRAAITSMIIGAETGLGNSFPHHQAYAGGWVTHLQDKPFDMAKIAADVQKSVSLLLGFGRQQDQKKSTEQSVSLDKGDSIAYNNLTYNVVGKRGKVVTVEREDGERFKANPADKIYASLVEARNNPPQEHLDRSQEPDKSPAMLQEQQQTHKIGR